MIIDINCFYGHWPFRKVPCESMEEISASAKKHHIDSMIISSTNAIFYQDHFEGDEELAAVLPQNCYQALTIDPSQPYFADDLQLGIEQFRVKAVRIHPEYHHYNLTDPCVTRLFDMLHEYNLPLLLTNVMEDPRMLHTQPQRAINYDEIASMILRNKKIPVVVTNMGLSDWKTYKGIVEEYGNLNLDTSGLKSGLSNVIETVVHEFGVPATNLLYGSHYPLYCRESTLNYFKMDPVSEDIKNLVLHENAKRIFGI